MSANQELEKKFLESAKAGNIVGVKEVISQVDVNCKGDEGMTPLMYAAYKGSTEIVDLLLQNGADANLDSQKDQYTPLMFATISGSTDTVRMLLEAGAKPDAVNKIKRTAAQLGAFVGRHDCVSVINNFVQTDQINYYTKKHGFEESAKLDDKLASSLHKLVVIPNLNPVKLVMFLQEHPELIEANKDVLYVLETEVEKSFKDVNEVLSIKLHLFSHVFKKCVAWETGKEGKGGIKGLLKYLLKGRTEDGFLINAEQVMRDSLRTFPYGQSNLFKQILKTVSATKPGYGPSTVAVFTQSINGMQSTDFSECCSCCGDRHCFNKCSACKMVRYCNGTCQKLHWSAHKNFCKQLREQYEEKIRQEKLEKEREEAERKEREEAKQKENEAPCSEAEIKISEISDTKQDGGSNNADEKTLAESTLDLKINDEGNS